MYEKIYLKSEIKAAITLYIRPDTGKQRVIDLLNKEEPIINNIKSRITRQGIQAAFQKLRTFINRIPPSQNGYIICSTPDALAFIDDILVPIDKYYCGGEFYADPLEEILVQRLHPIGIITIDTKEATLAYVRKELQILKHMTSGISGKHGKGGQSQRRFQRKRQEEVKHFFRRACDASKIFLTTYSVEEILLAGCGMTKDHFLKDKGLDPELKEKVLKTFDTQYTGEEGIRETLHKALPQLQKNAFAKEVKTVEDFFDLLGKRFECVVYGHEQIMKELPMIKRLIKIEEHEKDYNKTTSVLRFKGEHYDKIKKLGGVVGVKC